MDEPVKIPLSRLGYAALVDPVDVDLVDEVWHLTTKGRCNYAYTNVTKGEKKTTKQMHRFVMERVLGRSLSSKEEIDHINHNGLDNRRSYLRVATRAQNSANMRRAVNNTSGYKGVQPHRQFWSAEIKVDQKVEYLGDYETKEDAGIAYNHAARKHFGEFAYLNDIPGWEFVTPLKREKHSCKRRDCTTGFIGVSLHGASGKYQANYKGKYIGLYDTAIEANNARIEYAKQIKQEAA